VSKSHNKSYFLPIWEIAKKEVKSYFHSSLAWFILAFVCFIDGLLGYWGIKKESVSNKSIQLIFYVFSGTIMISGVLLAMRLFAEEKALGTLELLITGPLTEMQMALGKYFSALFFLLVIIAATIPIPLTVVIFGDAHWGHIVAGYFGVTLIGAASIAVTIFYSTLTDVQLLAAIMGGANVVFFLLLGFFSPYISNPMKEIMRHFSFYIHYMDFEKGVIVIRHVVFFLSIIVLYLYLAIISLRSRRWA